MDREEIIKLAREVGYPLVEYEGTPYIPPLLAVLLKAVATPQRTWVELTDEEIWSAVDRIGASDSDVNPYQILNNARAIEAKLKEKNT